MIKKQILDGLKHHRTHKFHTEEPGGLITVEFSISIAIIAISVGVACLQLTFQSLEAAGAYLHRHPPLAEAEHMEWALRHREESFESCWGKDDWGNRGWEGGVDVRTRERTPI